MTTIQVTVALLGLGNVGRAFLQYVNSVESPIRAVVAAVADSSGGLFVDKETEIQSIIEAKRTGRKLNEIAGGNWVLNLETFISALPHRGASFLVESLPTNIESGEPALTLIIKALTQGTNVVTVDKGPLAHGFAELESAQRNGGTRLGFSGTTGVSIPDELLNDRVLEIRGVLNGTTNHVLSQMQQSHTTFDEALASAQAAGIAEPDPSLDIQGWDTVVKMLILAKTLMGADTRLADVSRIGIGPETESLIAVGRDSGRMVRLVGRARIWQGRVRVSVAPKLVEPGTPFYDVSGTSKAAVFRTERQGSVLAVGRSGRDAISQTILDDIVKIMVERDRQPQRG
jgi:homoserine dehydrogenase